MAEITIEVQITCDASYEIEIEVDYGVTVEIEVEVEEEEVTLEEDVEVYGGGDDWQSWNTDFNIPAVGWFAQFGQKQSVDFEDLKLDLNGNLTGRGSDAVGGFYLSGRMDQNNWFTFVKQYFGAHQVFYRGRMNRGVMTGKWEIPGNCDGTFNIMPGWQRWRGAFWQFGNRTEMALDSMYIGEQGVKGSGWDDVGSFTISGYMDGPIVQFAKHYQGAHTVFYQGFMNGNTVKGRWNIPGNCDGVFTLKSMRG
jgi:hypothetical protein